MSTSARGWLTLSSGSCVPSVHLLFFVRAYAWPYTASGTIRHTHLRVVIGALRGDHGQRARGRRVEEPVLIALEEAHLLEVRRRRDQLLRLSLPSWQTTVIGARAATTRRAAPSRHAAAPWRIVHDAYNCIEPACRAQAHAGAHQLMWRRSRRAALCLCRPPAAMSTVAAVIMGNVAHVDGGQTR